MKISRCILMNLCLVCLAVDANTKPQKNNVWIETELSQTVCWYQDKKYSQGAVINVDKLRLMCTLKYENQTNGPLIWLPLDENNKPIKPKSRPKITIN